MDSISQNSIEVDVQVNNADALDKLASDMGNIKKLAGGGVSDPYKDLKKSASGASGGVSRVASSVNKTADTLKNGEGKASSFASRLKEVKKISFDKVKAGAAAFTVKLREAASVSFDKLSSGIKSVSGALGSGIKKAAGFAAKGVGIAAGGVAALTGLSVKAYGDYEQLKGGVETLFGAGGLTIEKYAESAGKSVDAIRSEYDGLIASQDNVLKNASNAYKTAGLSANDYMESVTAFSASLKQSFDKTPEGIKAAGEAANQAIIDMADNANKMGTPMEDIQNAYQGFAKQNYTMLDNLKLGYGGTKEEMERLLKDAQKFSGVKYDISNLSDIFSAVHIIQEQLGITNTTAEEAEKTIQGSFSSMKSAWGNLLTAFVVGGDDFDQCIENMIEAVKIFGKNVLPVISKALNGIGALIERLAPVIAEKLPALAEQLLPPLLKAAGSVVQGIIKALPSIIKVLIKEIPGIVKMLVQAVADVFGDSFPIVKSFGSLIEKCAGGIGKAIPFIIGAVFAFKGFSIVRTAAGHVNSFISPFKSLADKVSGGKMGNDLSGTAKGMTDTGNAAAGSSQKLLSMAKAFVLMAVGVFAIAAAFAILARSAIALAGAGPLAIGVMGGMVIAAAALGIGMMLLLKSLSTMGISAIQGAAAMAILGGALILTAIAFALLVRSAIALASAGPLAIGVMAGMLIGIAALMVLAAVLGPALTAGAIGFIAFGAAILMVGAGALLAAKGLTLVTSCLPIIVQYGLSGAMAIITLGVSLAVFAGGAALAGAASIVLGAGLLIACVGIIAFSAALLVGAAVLTAITAVLMIFAAVITIIASSLMIMAASFMIIAVSVPMAAAGLALLPVLFTALIVPAGLLAAALPLLAVAFAALIVSIIAVTVILTAFVAVVTIITASLMIMAASFASMAVSVPVFAAGIALLPALFLALVIPSAALSKEIPGLASAFQILALASVIVSGALMSINSSLSLTSAGFNMLSMTVAMACQRMIMTFTVCGSRIASICARIVSQSRSCASGIRSAFASVSLSATGSNIMNGLLNGIQSRSGAVIAQARLVAQSVSSAMNSALDIHSPSRVTMKTGVFAAQGLAEGMRNGIPQVETAARSVALDADASMDMELRAYSPESTGTARTFYGGNTTIAPVFQLDIHGAVSEDDRTTERAVKRWVLEALETVEESMSRKQRTVQVL